MNTKNLNGPTSTDNDPFDEFEFKPLTEGLGFHPKSIQKLNTANETLKTGTATKFTTEKRSSEAMTTQTTGITSSAKGRSSADHALNGLEFKTSGLDFETTSPIKSPLPRATTQNNLPRRSVQTSIPMIEDDSIAQAQTAVNDLLKSLNHKKQQEEIMAKAKKRLTWVDSTPSMIASGLDAMLVTAGFLIALIAMLSITKIDLLTNLSNPGNHNMLWIATAFLFCAVHMVYMVVFRAYLGYTPGEWAFDQRCGTETEQASLSYIPKVALRSLIVILTGFLPTTVISMIMGRDFVGRLVGLQMQTQTYQAPHHS